MRDAPNPANRRSGRGLSQYDRAAAWILSHSWELPYGRGKPFGSTAGGVTKAALAGWQFSGITTLESGFPFTPVLSNNSTLNADFGQRPDVIRNWGVPEQTRAHWYDPSAFRAPEACCRLGNAGTNIIRGPRLFTVDWAFGKEFVFRESKRLELRWENFNFF